MTRTIGLLGGSFNPAHAGHLHITLHALEALHFDEVWWLVSPQNPLKASSELAEYEKRLDSARRIASGYRRIRVLDIEKRLGTHYSYQTIAALWQRHPGTKFVWLMGADNLEQLHRWRRWKQIVSMIPIVVFDRAPYSHTSLRSKAALRLKKFMIKNNAIDGSWQTPRFMFIHLPRHPLSSTDLRKKLGSTAFLGHNKIVERYSSAPRKEKRP